MYIVSCTFVPFDGCVGFLDERFYAEYEMEQDCKNLGRDDAGTESWSS